MEHFIDNTTNLSQCRDVTSARNTLDQLTKMTYFNERELWMATCPVPCHQTVFTVKLSPFHLNNRLDFLNETSKEIMKNYVTLTMGFNTFAIEEREETLVYNAGSFLAAGLR